MRGLNPQHSQRSTGLLSTFSSHNSEEECKEACSHEGQALRSGNRSCRCWIAGGDKRCRLPRHCDIARISCVRNRLGDFVVGVLGCCKRTDTSVLNIRMAAIQRYTLYNPSVTPFERSPLWQANLSSVTPAQPRKLDRWSPGFPGLLPHWILA